MVEKEFLFITKEALNDEWPSMREALIKTFSLTDDEGDLRSLESSLQIAEVLTTIHKQLHLCFKELPDLQNTFDKEFGHYDYFVSRDGVVSICFLEDYLFPDKQLYPLLVDGEFSLPLLQSYIQSFSDWIAEKKEAHIQTQSTIREQKNSPFQLNKLPCQCFKCVNDFRGKFREIIFNESIELIDSTALELMSSIDEQTTATIGKKVASLLKSIEKNIHTSRTHLKRASISKLEDQVKNYFKTKFSYQTPIGQKHGELYQPVLKEYLKEQNLSEDLILPQEYDRFYRQLGSGLWKDSIFIVREFAKWLQSVLRLKRKDISARILQEYLGQFWRHNEARKLHRRIVYHMGPTNSGKTYHAIESLCKAKSGCYLAPLRLLAGELYDTMNSKGVPTTLLTGEEVIETPKATHYSSTIEMVRLHEVFECAVIDEIQMMSDSQRGWAWTRALIGVVADEVHVCGDDSVFDLVQKIVEMTGDFLEVRRYERLTRLEVMNHPISLGNLEKGDALIVFSRKNALNYKRDLEHLGFKVSIIYGRLGPEVRREQARKFDSEETDIIVSTDAIAMGMNLPIRRIVFSALSKFIDSEEFPLSVSEIKQIAGRAGRYLRFPIGYITTLTRVDGGVEEVREATLTELEQKKFVMVGPDLDIFAQVNEALEQNSLPLLDLSEFLRLFNTMTFAEPFYCVDLKEMIELAEMVEHANAKYKTLTFSEIFGFACAPVNLGIMEHVQYFISVMNQFIRGQNIKNEEVNHLSDNIDYLETAIKCVELYQWLARHFYGKFFEFDLEALVQNKILAIEKLNRLLSERLVITCSSCGKKLPVGFQFNICQDCFLQMKKRRYYKELEEEFSDIKKDYSRGKQSQSSRQPKKSSTGTGPTLGKKKSYRKKR